MNIFLPPEGDILVQIQWGIAMVFQIGLPFLVGVFALIGVVVVLTTRPDAFDAADRRSRGIWAGLLGGSALFLLFPMLSRLFLGIPMIAGMVITGIYWLDVRPQIKDLIANAQG